MTKYFVRCEHPEQAHLRFDSWVHFGKLIAETRRATQTAQADIVARARANGEKIHVKEVSMIENGICIPVDKRRLECILAALILNPSKEKEIRKAWREAFRESSF